MNYEDMIISAVLKQVIEFWWVFPIIICIAITRTAWYKGRFGEAVVNYKLSTKFKEPDHIVIKDVLLPSGEGTTQIDHILVSVNGIFVIETKNMTGWIFGSERSRQWTQQIYRKKIRFQNPIRQNYKHLKSIEALINYKAKDMNSVIVFAGDGKSKTKMPDNVMHVRHLVKYLESFNRPVLSQQEVFEIAGAITDMACKSTIRSRRKHNEHVNSLIDKK